MVALYNQTRPFRKKTSKPADDTSVQLDELAFAQLFAYIDECLEEEEPAVLTLSDLVRFYTSKVQELCAECGKVNATRLKERVAAAFPDLTVHAEGREIRLVPQHDIGGMLSKAKKMDSDSLCLGRAAHIVRREIPRTGCSLSCAPGYDVGGREFETPTRPILRVFK